MRLRFGIPESGRPFIAALILSHLLLLAVFVRFQFTREQIFYAVFSETALYCAFNCAKMALLSSRADSAIRSSNRIPRLARFAFSFMNFGAIPGFLLHFVPFAAFYLLLGAWMFSGSPGFFSALGAAAANAQYILFGIAALALPHLLYSAVQSPGSPKYPHYMTFQPYARMLVPHAASLALLVLLVPAEARYAIALCKPVLDAVFWLRVRS
jgi:hypothetical protein